MFNSKAKPMRRIYIILLMVILGSCSDFLELSPEDRLSQDDFYQTLENFESALIGTYAELQNLHNDQLIFFTEATTDNTDITFSVPSTAQDECNQVAFTSPNTLAQAVWETCFNIISRSNIILSRLEESELEPDERQSVSGEAKFLRAYSYFVLVRLYGDLPLIANVEFNSPEEIEEFDMTRRSTEEIYALIEQDLRDSAADLSDFGGGSKSRASEGAANALLGKVLLTQGKYDESITTYGNVISSNEYSLNPQYESLFSVGNDELEESIFEIIYLSGNLGEGSQMTSLITIDGVEIAINGLRGAGRLNPTDNMLNAYEPGDLRRDVSLLDSVLTVDNTYDPTNIGLKFLDTETNIQGDSGINYIALRYADVLLSLAEAQNEVGNTSAALSNINLVRARAGLGDLGALSQSEIRLALENERRVEFFLEGHRWFDLIRTNRVQTVINDYFQSIGSNNSVEDFELLIPIPLLETTINPELTQNPGY